MSPMPTNTVSPVNSPLRPTRSAELAVEEVVVFTQGLEFLCISVSAETHLLLGSPRLGTVPSDFQRICVAVSPEEMCGVGAQRHDVIRLRGEAP